MPPSLTNWSPAEPVPADIDHRIVATAIAAYDRAMLPASPEAFAVTFDRLLSRARMWGIKLPQRQTDTDPDPLVDLVRAYRQDLADVPADLLDQAITWACRHWTNGFRLPTPGELRNQISDQMSRRTMEKGRLNLALLRLPKDRPSAKKKDQVEASAALAAVREKLVAEHQPGRPVWVGVAMSSSNLRAEQTLASALLTGLSLEERVARRAAMGSQQEGV